MNKIEQLDEIWRSKAVLMDDLLLQWMKDKKITRIEYYDLQDLMTRYICAYTDYQIAINSIKHKLYMKVKRYLCGLFKHKYSSEEDNCSRCGFPYRSY